MSDVKMPITLFKSESTLSFIIHLFSAIQNKANDKSYIIKGNSIEIVKKTPEEITKLNADTKELEGKIFSWIHDASSVQLDFSNEESDLFEHIADAAYYFLTETNDKSKGVNEFINFYKEKIKKAR